MRLPVETTPGPVSLEGSVRPPTLTNHVLQSTYSTSLRRRTEAERGYWYKAKPGPGARYKRLTTFRASRRTSLGKTKRHVSLSKVKYPYSLSNPSLLRASTSSTWPSSGPEKTPNPYS